MKGEICICPKTWLSIQNQLKKTAGGFRLFLKLQNLGREFKPIRKRVKKRRTAAQKRATKKLIAFNKRRRARR